MEGLFLYFTAFLCITTACHKKHATVPALPTITATGANTMGCKINGTVWPIKGGLSIIEFFDIGARHGQYDLFFSSDIDNSSFYFHLLNIYKLGAYKLNYNTGDQQGNETGPYAEYSLGIRDDYKYMTDTTHTGTVTILKVDTKNHILSGTFCFTAHQIRPKDSTNTVTITEGRFDVKRQSFQI